jgi:hypothetical protein
MCTAHRFHYCCSEVHAEDNVRKSEIQPNSSIADVQSGSTGLKYVLSCNLNSQRKFVLHIASISRMISIFILVIPMHGS